MERLFIYVLFIPDKVSTIFLITNYTSTRNYSIFFEYVRWCIIPFSKPPIPNVFQIIEFERVETKYKRHRIKVSTYVPKYNRACCNESNTFARIEKHRKLTCWGTRWMERLLIMETSNSTISEPAVLLAWHTYRPASSALADCSTRTPALA